MVQALAKAEIHRLNPDGTPAGKSLTVQFNPNEYTLVKGAKIAQIPIFGIDSPILQFVAGTSETMSFELFFDSTEDGTGTEAKPVTKRTDEFYDLIKIDGETHAPPVVLFAWGADTFPGHRRPDSQSRHGFKALVEQVRQRFTYFSSLGVPLRATLSLTLREYKTLDQQIAELNLRSPDHTKAHVVQTGETITRIAQKTAGDPRSWRRIAEANAIDDPFSLAPGTQLAVPPEV
ncbi:LysM peptidoglycan-binding domain-containing protein [Oceaniovalibus sp. ACAM 378]|jgi:nucleoid-associated protein YgaU|uniref:CIS tube protein n=1 Tax=Oceaniovalibus sp. ACAM 378 TaxID=2599923 RepID=UPI0011D68BC4|nr:LysM peptidoglycan-binding domain-containing protein [Oceaniovalibus sp. ACAM 378]TYB89925.1 LysM peptidoglycan-binding domain-containing protein [Oceaniovalibus sp. ACAM 378]